ncbi:MAG: phenylacetate--CoA ligase family protein [Bacteroidales bacterium]|nr:phenylacetate--CoA ligase family protein [Bacteroidales bacterium]
MNFRSFIASNIMLPIGDIITGQPIKKQLTFLGKSQFWTRDEIDKYQNIMLRKLIQHAYKNVPYYTELFDKNNIKPDDIVTKDDLQKIPITTKEDLKRNKDKHLALNIRKKDILYRSSSGSTGEPFQFYKTKNSEALLKAAAIRAWYWMGYKLGDRYVKVSMNERSSLLKKIQDYFNNCLYLSSTQLTSEEFTEIENKILNYNPSFIRCYPVPLHYLSQLIKKHHRNYNGKNLIAINTTGSTLHNDIRQEIQDVFKVNIYDAYSCEGGAVFAECPTHSNYHPSEEYAISEFISDSFTLSDKDNPRRLITTDLHNYASPFIRYDTQDYIVLGENMTCKCGRHFQNISKIKGRDSDILITPSGKYLVVENFVAYFEWITEVDQIQVIQSEINEIQINMVVNENFNEETHLKLSEYWKTYIGSDVDVKLNIVDQIKLTPSGKRRTVIRNPEIRLNDR